MDDQLTDFDWTASIPAGEAEEEKEKKIEYRDFRSKCQGRLLERVLSFALNNSRLLAGIVTEAKNGRQCCDRLMYSYIGTADTVKLSCE